MDAGNKLTFANKTFVANAHVGVNVDAAALRDENDAVVICTGATWPRDLKIPNRNADGVHFAREYLQVWINPLIDKFRTEVCIAEYEVTSGLRAAG